MPILAQFQKRPATADSSADDGALSSESEGDSDSDEGEDPVAAAEKMRQAAYNQKVIKLELQKLTQDSSVVVPLTPAPPQSPGRTKKTIPANFIVAKPKSALERTLNSSSGRLLTAFLTVINFGLVVLGCMTWNGPDRWIGGDAVPMGVATLLAGVNLYTSVPALASLSGLMPSPSGVDWKPYFVFYRLSYFTSVPALGFMYFGPGGRTAFGEAEGGIEDISITALTIGSEKYFRAYDGFVALNLTKGITETLYRTEHNPNVPRSSRFRDAQIVNNREPYSDEAEPTVPPGFQEVYRIAPVFVSWAPCVTRYRISAGCLKQNPVAGWAVATARSLCTSMRMVSCREQSPILNPVYKCATTPITGTTYKDPIAGLCGRSTAPPASEVIDELSALFLLDGWPENTLPNATQGWYNVWPSDCVANTEQCFSTWNTRGQIGLSLCGLTVFLVALPMIIDFAVDRRIRQATEFAETCRNLNKKSVAVF